jgi:hypothetical protein
LPQFQRVSVFSLYRLYKSILYGNSPEIGRGWARKTLIRPFHHNVAGFLIIMAVESEKQPGCTSCVSPSPPLQPQIDSLPRYAPLTDSLPYYARKRPQAGCLTARNDVGALPRYAGKICHIMREVTRASATARHTRCIDGAVGRILSVRKSIGHTPPCGTWDDVSARGNDPTSSP